MEAVLRARTLSETRRFLEALVEDDGDRILGFTAFGVRAGKVMSAVQIAVLAGLPYTALRDAVLTHPTLVEGLIPLFSSVASAATLAEKLQSSREIGREAEPPFAEKPGSRRRFGRSELCQQQVRRGGGSCPHNREGRESYCGSRGCFTGGGYSTSSYSSLGALPNVG